MSSEMKIPAGLKLHCTTCGLVVPSDAPDAESADCAFVARHKLAWFNPAETPAAQHVMAVAAWRLIHDSALRAQSGAAETPASHAAARAYWAAHVASRRAHFAASDVRKAMSEEQVQAGKAHRRDGSLY